MTSSTTFNEPDDCIDALIARVGKDMRVATPLAAGKPNHLLNALYRRACSDGDLTLTIYTALTLQKPAGQSFLERRFMGPFAERVFGNYPDLDYELDRVAGRLPRNVRVIEFYFPAGKYLRNAAAQRDYISSNYTHAARDLLERGVNVLMQQVATGRIEGRRMLSLSCNPDLSVDLMRALRRQQGEGKPVAFVAQTNHQLPFMYGDAVVDPDDFHFIVDNREQDYQIFGPPKMSVGDAEYAIGVHVASLIRDGGELQVGIGALGDAVVYALLLRHKNAPAYARAVRAFADSALAEDLSARFGGTAPFEQGLFVASEMLVDGFLELYRAGVIRRRVLDDPALQRLLNQGRISHDVTEVTLRALLDSRAINAVLTTADVDYLKHWGVFRSGVELHDGHLSCPGMDPVGTNLLDPNNWRTIVARCLGDELLHSAVMHGGFFLGPQSFYQGLRDLSDVDRALIQMRSVTRINQLYGHEEIDRLHRRDARFVNTCMMATLLGAAVSDGLEDGRVVSGVGGQYNFVEMAHALPDGHSILTLRSTHTGSSGQPRSSIVWNYGHVTIPRHLRDIYVTEYGVAHVRGKTDEEIVHAMLSIADSRFQPELLRAAKAAGKVASDYEIPAEHRGNFPERVSARLSALKGEGLFPSFPFGCDFTPIELRIGKALKNLKREAGTRPGLVRVILRAIRHGSPDPSCADALTRMDLLHPKTLSERFHQRLLVSALRGSS